MEWPVHSPAIDDCELSTWQFYYAAVCRTPMDPTIVWGTEIDLTQTQEFLSDVNAESDVLISMAHLLLQSVAVAISRHPEFNRRVIRRRVYEYKTIDLVVPLVKKGRSRREVELLVIDQADRKSLSEFAALLWEHSRAAACGELDGRDHRTFPERMPRWVIRKLIRPYTWRFNNFNMPRLPVWKQENRGVAMVNYFGGRSAPPMHSYKPSRFPSDACPLNITMGPTHPKPVVHHGEIVARPLAPLFLRADHRLTDAHDMQAFLTTLRECLENPASMQTSELIAQSKAA